MKILGLSWGLVGMALNVWMFGHLTLGTPITWIPDPANFLELMMAFLGMAVIFDFWAVECNLEKKINKIRGKLHGI